MTCVGNTARRSGRLAASILLCLVAGAAAAQEPALASFVLDGPPPLTVEAPRVAVAGVDATFAVTLEEGFTVDRGVIVVRDAAESELARVPFGPDAAPSFDLELPAGRHTLRVSVPGVYGGAVDVQVRSISGWLTILPPALAILLALLFRQVIPALLAGVWLGAWLAYDGFFLAFLRTADGYLIGALTDGDHIKIIVFSMFLGGMVGVMSRCGGTAGLVDALQPYATTSRRGQLVTWLLGLLVFFDDYANTLVVGNTMRPVTDRLRISREKLAYIVDSTAAPVAAIFLISTWIGYEVSMIDDALREIGSTADGYAIFLQAIPYNFYPILALVFVFLVAARGRDFGPMLKAERRAAAGRVMSDNAAPLADFDGDALKPRDDRPRRWLNAAIPVAVVLFATFAGLWITGRQSLTADGDPAGQAALFDLGVQGLGTVFGAGNSFNSLLYAAISGCTVAIALAVSQRILRLGQALEAMVGGFKSMMMAFVILTLAWAIADVCKDLNTSSFMVSALSDRLDPRWLPSLVFLFSALTAFATGTSWGTMGILIPLAVPSSFALAENAGLSPDAVHGILLGTVASVLAGAIFGDHCSPISDTTVLSSMASGCDHVDHVRTQLPYALLVGGVAMLLGSVPAGFGVSPWISLVVCTAVLVLAMALLSRPVRA